MDLYPYPASSNYFPGTRINDIDDIARSSHHIYISHILPDRKRVELFDLADSKWSDRRWHEDAALPWTLLAQAASQTTNCGETGLIRPSDTL